MSERARPLTVMVATFNRLPLLRTVIDAIEHGTRTPHELIVIDGGSTDGTIEYLASHPAITPVLQGRLMGTARCYNAVWRGVGSTYSCWLSDDTEIVPGSLDAAVGILEADPGIGMVGLKMKDTRGPGRHDAYRGGLSEYGILNCNHGVLPTRLARQVGFFNESYRAYMIDPDLTASILCTGHRVVMTKAVAVLHHREWAEQEGDEKVAREMGGIDNFAIYRRKFAFLAAARTPAVRLRAGAVRYVSGALFHLAGPGATRAGLSRRDWVNLGGARFTSPLDALQNRGRPYHLVQALPASLVAAAGNPYRAGAAAVAPQTTCLEN
ncbi:MAG: glycosyltransferase [Acidobacteria bacterium]|nr:glycosyltransferase [Acidobacteriota bacterium]